LIGKYNSQILEAGLYQKQEKNKIKMKKNIIVQTVSIEI
jgi:hypothetical protein